MKRFEDYKREVILAYEKKKKEGTLPRKLASYTTANLKAECLNVFHNRYSEKDSETFKSLFGERDSGEEYVKRIKAEGPDKFKPLDNFLKGKVGTPKEITIELLAWFIDFEPRPYKSGDIYVLVKSEWESANTQTIQTPLPVPVSEPAPVSIQPENPQGETQPKESELLSVLPIDAQISNIGYLGIPVKFYKGIIAFFAAVIIIVGSYFIYDKPQCMYWDGEQYQSIDCDQKVDGATIVALDTFRLAHLKRIKNIALITRNDIGKIHYSKINGKVEFYTTGGENPADSRKRLLPMSEHMYVEYVEPAKSKIP